MVAELFRLRVRLLVNAFRRPAGGVFGIVVGLVTSIGALALAWQIAPHIQQLQDGYAARFIVTSGSFLSFAALAIPVLFVRNDTLHPRAFRSFRLSTLGIIVTLLVFGFLGPLTLLVFAAYLPTVAWPNPLSRDFASVAAPVIFVMSVLSVLVGRQLGVALRRHPTTSALVRLVGILLLLCWGFAVAAIAAQRVPQLHWLAKLTATSSALQALPASLAATPFGMLWAAPGLASGTVNRTDDAWSAIWSGVAVIAVLLAFWAAVVWRQLRPTHRLAVTRRALNTAWFGRLPATPTGAVSARSISYWLRDPRYRTVFVLVPVLPIVILLALSIAGVPFRYAALVPLPILVLFFSWSTMHNDVAYDSTAIWSHLAARVRGVHDRVGRMVPVLIFGILLIVVGAPLTAWGYGDLRILPAVLGVSIAILLGGIGISSIASAVFPYPAPRPGDGAFQQPQVTGSHSGAAQGISIGFVVLVAVPALVAAGLWLSSGGLWAWITLLLGAICGMAILVLGIRTGGGIFDRRGPELLAFSVRN